MSKPEIPVDIAIFGGGIAGLWLANVLRRRGFSCVLLERDELGGQQTLLSQGIIHGGLKYALGGTLSSESEAIAGMPDRWRAALAGNGDLDLRGVRVLSDTQHLWSAGSMASRVTTFFASRMLRGRIRKLKPARYPQALANEAFRGNVYELDDLVVDTETLVETLARQAQDSLRRFDPGQHALHWDDTGLSAIELDDGILKPAMTVLAAGAGNADLLQAAQAHQLACPVQTQLRPLHMVLVRHRLGLRLYAHCVGTSNKPRLTVTTHDLEDGSLVWYLGGDLAERGVDMDADTLVAQAREELAALFPWLDFSGADFATVRIDRAEPGQDKLIKPDNAYATRHQRLLVTWPTKLTLSPDLGDRVLALLDEAGVTPQHPQPSAATGSAVPAVARARWHTLFGHAS